VLVQSSNTQFYLQPTRLVYPQMESTIPAFTLQPQSITTLWSVLIFRPTEGRRLSWPEWLGHKPRWFTYLQTVTQLSTNWAQHRVILLIETNALPLSQAATNCWLETCSLLVKLDHQSP